MPKDKPTPQVTAGAYRATKKLNSTGKLYYTYENMDAIEEEVAHLFDQESGLKELLESTKELRVELFGALNAVEINNRIRSVFHRAEQAIKKVSGEG